MKNKIDSYLKWMEILDNTIYLLKHCQYHFKDGMPDRSFICELRALELDLNLPPSIATFLAVDLDENSTSRLLKRLEIIQMDLHDEYCEIAPLPAIELDHNNEDEMNAFLDDILEKQRRIKQEFKDKARRHYAAHNRLLVEEFESNPHLSWS
jgi:hypothetical protein